MRIALIGLLIGASAFLSVNAAVNAEVDRISTIAAPWTEDGATYLTRDGINPWAAPGSSVLDAHGLAAQQSTKRGTTPIGTVLMAKGILR